MAYLGNAPGVESQRLSTSFTATASQTNFNPVGGYTLGYVDVYLNGVKLVDGTDFTASDGVTVVLTTGAASGDNVELVTYTPRGLSDGYTKTEADGRYVNVTGDTMTGNLDVTGTVVADGLTASTSATIASNIFFNSTSGALRWQTDGGVEKMNLRLSGDNLKLESGAGIARALFGNLGDVAFYDASGSNFKFFWDASAESLGIGTTSINLVKGGVGIELESATGSEIILGNSVVSTVGGEIGGAVAFRSNDSSGTPDHYAGIIAKTSDTYGNMNLEFYSGRDRYEAGSAPNMVILGNTASTDGNVGIGETSPISRLHLAGDSSIVTLDDTAALGAGRGTSIRFRALSTASAGSEANIGQIGVYRENATSGNYAGYMAFYTETSGGSLTERMRIDSSGNLLVGTNVADGIKGLSVKPSTYATSLVFNAAATANYLMYFRYYGTNVGTIYTTNTSTSYNTSSDYRLKEDVQDMIGATDRVMALKPCNFAWKSTGERVDGFLAHEAQKVVPEAVHGTKDGMRTEEYEVSPAVEATYDEEGNELTSYVPAVMDTREVPDYQGIDQSKLVPLLTKALQEALTEIESLKSRVSALEAN